MLYECRDITLDLARIVAVHDIERRSSRALDGHTFGVQCSGIRTYLWITAPDKTPKEAMRLKTDREALIANWRRFRNTPARGGDVIFAFADMDLNLLAISGVTGVRSRTIGLSGATGTAPSALAYEVFLMGLDDPILRQVGRLEVASEAQLRAERERLYAAWAAAHHKGAA